MGSSLDWLGSREFDLLQHQVVGESVSGRGWEVGRGWPRILLSNTKAMIITCKSYSVMKDTRSVYVHRNQTKYLSDIQDCTILL